ncbi:MAG: hypothetical protein Q9220_005546 [cf. Caloplaca sp. 1 TL-2023]
MWHTQWDPVTDPFPHNFSFDMGRLYYTTKFTYLPRQDGSKNGNIGKWQLKISGDDDGERSFQGTWADDQSLKTVNFGQTTRVRNVALSAFSEAGNRGKWASASEFNMFGSESLGTSTFRTSLPALSSTKQTSPTQKSKPTSTATSAPDQTSSNDNGDTSHGSNNPLGTAGTVFTVIGGIAALEFSLTVFHPQNLSSNNRYASLPHALTTHMGGNIFSRFNDRSNYRSNGRSNDRFNGALFSDYIERDPKAKRKGEWRSIHHKYSGWEERNPMLGRHKPQYPVLGQPASILRKKAATKGEIKYGWESANRDAREAHAGVGGAGGQKLPVGVTVDLRPGIRDADRRTGEIVRGGADYMRPTGYGSKAGFAATGPGAGLGVGHAGMGTGSGHPGGGYPGMDNDGMEGTGYGEKSGALNGGYPGPGAGGGHVGAGGGNYGMIGPNMGGAGMGGAGKVGGGYGGTNGNPRGGYGGGAGYGNKLGFAATGAGVGRQAGLPGSGHAGMGTGTSLPRLGNRGGLPGGRTGGVHTGLEGGNFFDDMDRGRSHIYPVEMKRGAGLKDRRHTDLGTGNDLPRGRKEGRRARMRSGSSLSDLGIGNDFPGGGKRRNHAGMRSGSRRPGVESGGGRARMRSRSSSPRRGKRSRRPSVGSGGGRARMRSRSSSPGRGKRSRHARFSGGRADILGRAGTERVRKGEGRGHVPRERRPYRDIY